MSRDRISGSGEPLPPPSPSSLSRGDAGERSPVQKSRNPLQTDTSGHEASNSKELDELLKHAGLMKTSSGAIAVLDTEAAADIGSSRARQVYGSGDGQLRAAVPPAVSMNSETVRAAESFATHLDVALNTALLSATPLEGAEQSSSMAQTAANGLGDRLYPRGLAALATDNLLAAFLMLNITDPNNDPETHNKLHEISSHMRQLGIDESKERIEKAQEAKREADAYGQQAQYVSNVVTAATLASAAFTMGATLAGTAAIGATTAATATMATAAQIGVLTAMSGQIVEAGAKRKETELHIDASEARNDAARFELTGELYQDVLASEAEIMREIMESKNQTVESVKSMLDASFVSTQKLMAATTSRS